MNEASVGEFLQKTLKLPFIFNVNVEQRRQTCSISNTVHNMTYRVMLTEICIEVGWNNFIAIWWQWFLVMINLAWILISDICIWKPLKYSKLCRCPDDIKAFSLLIGCMENMEIVVLVVELSPNPKSWSVLCDHGNSKTSVEDLFLFVLDFST